jgi:hypothetical protein
VEREGSVITVRGGHGVMGEVDIELCAVLAGIE